MLTPEIYGLEGTSEYRAAQWLKNLVEVASKPSDQGMVALHTELNMGRQIDVLLHAYFQPELSRKLILPYGIEPENVSFLDIIAVIEVKALRKENVNISATNAFVSYKDGKTKSASNQSLEQSIAAKDLLSMHVNGVHGCVT